MNLTAMAANGAKISINPANIIEVRRMGNACKLWVFVNGCNYAEFTADNYNQVKQTIDNYKATKDHEKGI